MTTDAFTEAAFESAASKYQGDWDSFEQEPVDDYGLSESERRAHIAGWEAARTHLAAQEPTDAEVEAAAEGMWDRYGNRGMWKHAPDRLRLAFRADARAALSAARAARRDEETR